MRQMVNCEIFDDCCRFENRAVAIGKDGELAQRPSLLDECMIFSRSRFEVAEVEGYIVRVERNQRLPRV